METSASPSVLEFLLSRVWLKWKQSCQRRLVEFNSDRSVSQPRLSLSRPSGRAHKSPIMAENMGEQCLLSTVSVTYGAWKRYTLQSAVRR